jgi:hypothetical protein
MDDYSVDDHPSLCSTLLLLWDFEEEINRAQRTRLHSSFLPLHPQQQVDPSAIIISSNPLSLLRDLIDFQPPKIHSTPSTASFVTNNDILYTYL